MAILAKTAYNECHSASKTPTDASCAGSAAGSGIHTAGCRQLPAFRHLYVARSAPAKLKKHGTPLLAAFGSSPRAGATSQSPLAQRAARQKDARRQLVPARRPGARLPDPRPCPAWLRTPSACASRHACGFKDSGRAPSPSFRELSPRGSVRAKSPPLSGTVLRAGGPRTRFFPAVSGQLRGTRTCDGL